MKNLGDESQSHNFNLKIWVEPNILEIMNMNMNTETIERLATKSSYLITLKLIN